jgi:hypothetical protein
MSGRHVRHQFGFALGQFHTQRVEVEIGFLHLREYLALFFLDVMLHVFGQHLDLGVAKLVARDHRFELLDE